MGQKRRATERLKCGECGSEGYAPCKNKRTGREIKGFHGSRRFAGRNTVLNRQVAEIERDTEAEHYFMFAWLVFGGEERTYPGKATPDMWASLYSEHPDYHPGQRYWGTW